MTDTAAGAAKDTTTSRVATVADRRTDQAKEYGTYTAIEAIDLGGVRAFNIGDPVPVGHVERGVVDETLVAKNTTKAAATALATASGAETSE